MTINRRWIGLVTVCIVGLVACTGADAESEARGETTSESTLGGAVACDLSRAQILAGAGTDKRKEAINRGFRWLEADVPYSENASHEGYRTDSAGFLSMCWTLDHSYATADFVRGGGTSRALASYEELVPGDALIRSGLASLFLGWNDDAHSDACVLELTSTTLEMQLRARSTIDLLGRGTRAYRSSGLPTGATPAPAPAPTTTPTTPKPAPTPAPKPAPAPAPKPAPAPTTKPPPAPPPPAPPTKPKPQPAPVVTNKPPVTPTPPPPPPPEPTPVGPAPKVESASDNATESTGATEAPAPASSAAEDTSEDGAEAGPTPVRTLRLPRHDLSDRGGCSMPGSRGASSSALPILVALGFAISRSRRRTTRA